MTSSTNSRTFPCSSSVMQGFSRRGFLMAYRIAGMFVFSTWSVFFPNSDAMGSSALGFWSGYWSEFRSGFRSGFRNGFRSGVGSGAGSGAGPGAGSGAFGSGFRRGCSVSTWMDGCLKSRRYQVQRLLKNQTHTHTCWVDTTTHISGEDLEVR